MIQVIKEGIPKRVDYKKYQVTCNSCGTVFVCDSYDLEDKHTGEELQIVNCPLCRKMCCPHFDEFERVK